MSNFREIYLMIFRCIVATYSVIFEHDSRNCQFTFITVILKFSALETRVWQSDYCHIPDSTSLFLFSSRVLLCISDCWLLFNSQETRGPCRLEQTTHARMISDIQRKIFVNLCIYIHSSQPIKHPGFEADFIPFASKNGQRV